MKLTDSQRKAVKEASAKIAELSAKQDFIYHALLNVVQVEEGREENLIFDLVYNTDEEELDETITRYEQYTA